MKVFVELNDRVTEIEAESVSQLRVEIVKRLSVDITQFEMRSVGASVDDGFALEPGMLVHLVSKDAPKDQQEQKPQNSQTSLESAQTSADNWKALFSLALAADDLVGKTLKFAVDNSDALVTSAQALLARFGLQTTFGRMSPAEVKEHLHELLEAALGEEGQEDAEECEEIEEASEGSDAAHTGDKE